MIAHIGSHSYLMCKHCISEVKFAPLYIHSVKLLQPHTLVEAQKFNIIYHDDNLPTTTADKLRYYRYKKGLLQREVADFAGIDRTTYNSYESTQRDSFPLDKFSLVAEFLGVEITELLDEYNMFIYNGQGKQIKALRKTKRLTQREYAEIVGVPLGTLKNWETDKVQMFKSTWEKLFK